MRIAVLPSISQGIDITCESCYIVFDTWMKHMPQHRFLFMLPKGSKIDRPLPNVTYLCTEVEAEYNSASVRYPDNFDAMFHRAVGKYPVDLILTSRQGLGATMKQRHSSLWLHKNMTPVFVWCTKVMSEGGTHDHVYETELILRSCTFSQCPTMVITPYEKTLAVKEANRFLSGAMANQAANNIKVLSQGIDVDLIKKSIEGIKKRPQFTLYFGARLTSNKNYEKILQAYSDHVKKFKDDQIVVASPFAAESKNLEKWSSKLTLKEGLTQAENFKLQASCHVSTMMSNFEANPIGFTEQLISGTVLLPVDKPWSRSMLFPVGGKDYPFFFKGEMQLIALLKWVRENYDKAQEMVQPFREAYIKWNDIKHVTKELDSWWTKITEPTYPSYMDGTQFKEILDIMPRTFTFEHYIDVICEKYPTYAKGLRGNFVYTMKGVVDTSRRDALYFLRRFGAVDLQDGPEPRFTKPEKKD